MLSWCLPSSKSFYKTNALKQPLSYSWEFAEPLAQLNAINDLNFVPAIPLPLLNPGRLGRLVPISTSWSCENKRCIRTHCCRDVFILFRSLSIVFCCLSLGIGATTDFPVTRFLGNELAKTSFRLNKAIKSRQSDCVAVWNSAMSQVRHGAIDEQSD